MQEIDLTGGINYRLKPDRPIFCELSAQNMLTVAIHGDPSTHTAQLMPPLYGSAYAIRKAFKDNGLIFKVEKLRGRWENASIDLPKRLWSGIYALPIPEGVTELPVLKKTKNPDLIPLQIETWHYGKMAMILHTGSYATESLTIKKLFDYLAIHNLSVIPGSHEEIYISDPSKTEPDKLKTLILYRIQ